MPIATEKLQMVGGGYDAQTDPLALEMEALKTGLVKTPDCQNVIGYGETVETRLGCQPWLATGLTGKVYYVSTFTGLSVSAALAAGILTVGQLGSAYYLPTATNPAAPGQPGKNNNRSNPKPLSFQINAPVQNATGVSLTPTIQWTACKGATYYSVTISATTNRAGAAVWGTSTTATSAIVTGGALLAGTIYYLWVQTLVKGVLISATPVPVKFTTGFPSGQYVQILSGGLAYFTGGLMGLNQITHGVPIDYLRTGVAPGNNNDVELLRSYGPPLGQWRAAAQGPVGPITWVTSAQSLTLSTDGLGVNGSASFAQPILGGTMSVQFIWTP